MYSSLSHRAIVLKDKMFLLLSLVTYRLSLVAVVIALP